VERPPQRAVRSAHRRLHPLQLAYDDTMDVTERAIDSHVKNLRRKPARPIRRGLHGRRRARA